MSKDSRLGVNPLGWVAPGEADAVPAAPCAVAARPEEAAVPEARDRTGMILPVEKAPGPECVAPDAPAPALGQGAPERGLFSAAGLPGPDGQAHKGKVKKRLILETARAADYLRALADALESGAVRVGDTDESVVLTIPEDMHFEMKAGRKKAKEKFSLKLSWENEDGSH